MVAVMATPEQKVGEGPVGVMVYVTVRGALVELVKEAAAMASPMTSPDPLSGCEVVIPTGEVLYHANVVPVSTGYVPTTIASLVPPEQISCV